MIKDEKLRREIYVGVIVAILVMLFIEPLLRIAGIGLICAGANIYEGFSNQIYKDAALGFHEKFSFFSLAFFISFLAGIISGFSVAIFKNIYSKTYRKGFSIQNFYWFRLCSFFSNIHLDCKWKLCRLTNECFF